MCFYGDFGYPDPGAQIIESLSKGDIISVPEGAGYPAMPFARVLTIYEVDQFSALCTDGTRLSCIDGNVIVPTGKKDPKPVLSFKARMILTGLWLKNAKEWIKNKIRAIDADIWYLGYRFGKFLKS